MALYMKYGSINGEVKTKGFEGWIELHSVQWGVGRGISSGAGGQSKREASVPSVSEVTVTKTMDNSTPELLKEALGGKLSTKVEIALTRTDQGGKHVAFQTYTLADSGISGYSVSAGGDHPTESISLNFVKVESKHVSLDSAMQSKSKQFSYDVPTATLS